MPSLSFGLRLRCPSLPVSMCEGEFWLSVSLSLSLSHSGSEQCFLCWSRQNLKIHTTIKIAGKWIRVFVPLKIVIVFIVIECYWSIHNLRSPSWFVRLKHFLLMGLGPSVLKADPAGTRPLYSSHAHLLSHEKVVFFLSTSLFMFDVLPKVKSQRICWCPKRTQNCTLRQHHVEGPLSILTRVPVQADPRLCGSLDLSLLTKWDIPPPNP